MSFLPQTRQLTVLSNADGTTTGGLIVRDVQQHCATHHPHHLDLTTVAIDKVLGEIQSLRFQQDSIRQRIGSPPPSTWQSNTGSHNSAVIHR